MGYEIQYHLHWVNEELPRLIVNPFIVAVWSLFESAVTKVAELIKDKQAQALGLGDIKGQHLLDRIDKYYRHVLHFPLDLSSSRRDQLNFLGAIRNAIVHHNGRLVGLNKANRRVIQEGKVDGISENSFGSHLVIEIKFARSAFELVEEHLRILFDRYGTL